MGWSYASSWQTKSDLIRHLTRPSIWEEGGAEHVHRTIKHAFVGANLWTVYERIVGGASEWKHVVLYLMAKDKVYGWGYKDISEGMGPVEVNCPLSYLDGLSEPTHFGAEWRARVRAYHTHRAAQREHIKSLSPGDEVTIYGKEYAVIEVLPRGKLRVRDVTTKIPYLVRAKQVTLVGD